MSRNKSQLYQRVESSAGRNAVLAKCIEELNELRDEIDSTICDIVINKGISPEQYLRLVDENADVINTVEQVTKNMNMQDDLRRRCNLKLNRLEMYYLEGKLCDNLDMSVLEVNL